MVENTKNVIFIHSFGDSNDSTYKIKTVKNSNNEIRHQTIEFLGVCVYIIHPISIVFRIFSERTCMKIFVIKTQTYSQIECSHLFSFLIEKLVVSIWTAISTSINKMYSVSVFFFFFSYCYLSKERRKKLENENLFALLCVFLMYTDRC